MKNIHVLPTDKEPVKGDLLLRHIWKDTSNECISWWRYKYTIVIDDVLQYTTLNGSFRDITSSFKVQNIYITSDEEIKEGDSVVLFDESGIAKVLEFKKGYVKAECFRNKVELAVGYHQLNEWKKIILTTDQDLIKNGVQAIDDEFLEWFVKNPSCEYVEVNESPITNDLKGYKSFYKIIIPKEEPKQKWDIDTCRYFDMEVGCEREKCICENIPKEEHKQETLEEVALKWFMTANKREIIFDLGWIKIFEAGAKWQSERMYSEEEARAIWSAGQEYWRTSGDSITFEELTETFKNK